MTHRTALLIVVSAVTAVGPLLLAQSGATFDVTAVRPNVGSDTTVPDTPVPPDGLFIVNYPLDTIIRYAYDVQPFRVSGMPRWALEERFNISAKALRSITDRERRLMTRSLLIDRFQLKAHFETQEQTAYVMTTVRSDKTLGPAARPRLDCTGANRCDASGSSSRAAGVIRARAMTLDGFADGPLSLVLSQVVRNESGLGGVYDIQLSWRPDVPTDANDQRPSFFTAVEEQLGIKLTPQRRPVEILVIDSVERPTPN